MTCQRHCSRIVGRRQGTAQAPVIGLTSSLHYEKTYLKIYRLQEKEMNNDKHTCTSVRIISLVIRSHEDKHHNMQYKIVHSSCASCHNISQYTCSLLHTFDHQKMLHCVSMGPSQGVFSSAVS